MIPPSLTTKRLLLAPVTGDDLRWFLALNTLPAVRKFLWDDRQLSQAEARDILSKSQSHFEQDGFGLWKAKNGRTSVGYYGLWPFFSGPQPQLLYVTDPQFSGRGFAKEACEAVIGYAFSALKYPYVEAALDDGNTAAKALAKALGMALHDDREEAGKPTLFYRRAKAP